MNGELLPIVVKVTAGAGPTKKEHTEAASTVEGLRAVLAKGDFLAGLERQPGLMLVISAQVRHGGPHVGRLCESE